MIESGTVSGKVIGGVARPKQRKTTNLVSTYGISLSGDVISVRGSQRQNDARAVRLVTAIANLVDNFEDGIWDMRVFTDGSNHERGDFGY